VRWNPRERANGDDDLGVSRTWLALAAPESCRSVLLASSAVGSIRSPGSQPVFKIRPRMNPDMFAPFPDNSWQRRRRQLSPSPAQRANCAEVRRLSGAMASARARSCGDELVWLSRDIAQWAAWRASKPDRAASKPFSTQSRGERKTNALSWGFGRDSGRPEPVKPGRSDME